MMIDFGELSNSTLLIVDDQPRNLDVLISSLEDFGFEFLVAQDGPAAINRAKMVRPDMVLLDIMMPGMDGFEVCRNLRQLPDFESVPIIFMSALNETVDKLKGFSLGAVDYITKPFQQEEIIARIKIHLTIARLQRELNEANSDLEQKVQERTRALVAQIEERKQVETKYRILLETLQEGVWALDRLCRCTYMNPHMGLLLGIAPELTLGKTVLDFIPPHLQAEWKARMDDEKRFQRLFFDFELQNLAGNSFFVSISTSPLVDEHGQYAGLLMAVVDISQRKMAELELLAQDRILAEQNIRLQETNSSITHINNELRAAKERAEESDRLKTSFLSNLSHEIRTPMNAIVGFSDLLQADVTSPNRDSYLDYILRSTHQLKNIITDILEIAKLESQQYKLAYQGLDLHAVMQHATELLQEELQNSTHTHLELRLNYQQQPNCYFSGDAARIRDVFQRLIGNALKFTPSGHIELGYRLENDAVCFWVADSGIGIPEDAHSYIFERFRQVEESYTRNFGGTGLGLAIARGFVSLMGGRIWVESEPLHGSTFFFTVPLTNANLFVMENRTNDSSNSEAQKTILIAEDEDINVIYLQEVFASTSYRILVARNGREAVDIFAEHAEIGLVLLDIKMPRMNGFDALREIKQLRNVPVVAQTAYAMAEDEARSLAAGFDAYLAKPIKRERLLDIARKFLV